MRRFGLAIASMITTGALSLLTAIPAAAATEVGTTFDPGTSSCGNMLLQSVSPPADSYAAPFSGVVTSWSYQASEGPVQLKLKVANPEVGNSFTIVGESAVQTATANSLNTFPARISVQTGDVIGLTPVTIGLPCIRVMAGYSYSAYVMGSDVPPGTTATFNPPAPNQIDISAVLEADADGDGFGDETQDQCPGTSGPNDGCPSNTIVFGKLKRDKQKGTATLTVVTPGSGTLTLSGKGLVKQRVGGAPRALKAAAKIVGAAGAVTLKVRSKGKRKRKLIRTGEVKVKAKVTYTPTGGKPKTKVRRIKLVKQI